MKEGMYGREFGRLVFIEERDGKEAAIAFAKQGIRLYRSCVLQRKTLNRDKMICSYKFFKKYVRHTK